MLRPYLELRYIKYWNRPLRACVPRNQLSSPSDFSSTKIYRFIPDTNHITAFDIMCVETTVSTPRTPPELLGPIALALRPKPEQTAAETQSNVATTISAPKQTLTSSTGLNTGLVVTDADAVSRITLTQSRDKGKCRGGGFLTNRQTRTSLRVPPRILPPQPSGWTMAAFPLEPSHS